MNVVRWLSEDRSTLTTGTTARGWNEFWLAWTAVGLVGVPVLWHSHYYSTAIQLVLYGALVISSFLLWLGASRPEGAPEQELQEVGA